MSVAGSTPLAFLRRGLVVAAVNCGIAATLALARDSDWTRELAYSFAIGTSIWLLLDFGRFAFRQDPERGWPTGWRAAVLNVGGVGGGYVLGVALGDAFSGQSTLSWWDHSPRALFGYVVVSVAVSASIAFFFHARGKDQYRLRQIAAAQRDAAEAQLKLLQSQLEPHMLFNTLANLRVLIALDPPRAQDMLDRLIAFLRATLGASRAESHALAAEFERVADYLALMAVRMGPRLATRLTLPPALREAPVPPLLLQPLVENAIRHGLEPQPDGGRVELDAALDAQDGALLLTVRDTGVGLGRADATAGTRFGLHQVRQRLATLYGGRASLELAPAGDAEGGTRATIRLPPPAPAPAPTP